MKDLELYRNADWRIVSNPARDPRTALIIATPACDPDEYSFDVAEAFFGEGEGGAYTILWHFASKNWGDLDLLADVCRNARKLFLGAWDTSFDIEKELAEAKKQRRRAA